MKKDIVDIFTRLGERLDDFGTDAQSRSAIGGAISANEWFTHSDIVRSVGAIRKRMLCRPELERWLSAYPTLPVSRSSVVGVIMAGNIPLVGFFDLLCTLAAGHTCCCKPSSKDRVLMDYMIDQLRIIWPDAPVYTYIGQPLDAAIATGGDNSNRYFRQKYSGIPSLLRGTRASVAVLTGGETDEELAGLASDIFTYSGLGCRNVSHLILPRGYRPDRLLNALNAHPIPNLKYRNNFLQRSAVLDMQDIPYIKGDFFVLRTGDEFPASVSEITCHYYDDMIEVREWLHAYDTDIQCVTSHRAADFPRGAAFGDSQTPSLTDYPDGIDVMQFLANL